MPNQHTPGPWHWGKGFSDINQMYAECQLFGGPVHSVIIPIRIDHHEPVWDIDQEQPGTVFPSAADRALIAAAPALLDACIHALQYLGYRDSDMWQHAAADCRAAIALATTREESPNGS